MWAVWILVVIAVLYGLHRLALHLEDRGLLYYLHKKPSGGGSAFQPLQDVIQPQIRHVRAVSDERRVCPADDQGAPPDRTDAAE